MLIYSKKALSTREFSQSNFVGKMNNNKPNEDNSYHHNSLYWKKSLKWGAKEIKPTGKVLDCSNMGLNPCVFYYKHRVVDINASFGIRWESENDF